MEPVVVLHPPAQSADREWTVEEKLSRIEPVTINFDALFDAEYDGLVRVAYLMLGSNERAEEVVQDAFVAVYRQWDQLSNPGGFARTAVLNRCHDHLRRRTIKKRALRLVRTSEPTVREDDYLLDVLGQLDAQRRSMVVLRYYAGMSIPEIATTLGVAEGTVKSGISRSLTTMRKALES